MIVPAHKYYETLNIILIIYNTYFDGGVETSTSECVVVFRVDDDLHHIMCVALEHLLACPVAFPVPQLDQ